MKLELLSHTSPPCYDDESYYINFNLHPGSEHNCINFHTAAQEALWSSWLCSSPAFRRRHQPLTDETMADFISTIMTRQPKTIYVNMDSKVVWESEKGQKLLDILKHMCSHINLHMRE